MSEALNGLESYVETVAKRLVRLQVRDWSWRSRWGCEGELAETVVLALAEPLRRAGRVEDRTELREALIANMLDGEEAGRITFDASDFLDAVMECVGYWLDPEAKP